MRRVDPADLDAVCDALGDTPQTVIPLHMLSMGLADGWLTGTTSDPAALVIQNITDPSEPTAFGNDPVAIWDTLQRISNWTCVNVDPLLAGLLQELMRAAFPAVRLYDDIYYSLHDVLRVIPVPSLETRLIAPDDPLVKAGDPLIHHGGWQSMGQALTDGAMAVTIDDGRVVATAHITASSPTYADVGVFTLPEYRGRGLSTYAAYLVMQQALRRGRTPVWSTGEDNFASQRIAEKLGLRRDPSHRVYLIPQT